MRITGVEIIPAKLPLLEPFVVSYGTFPDLATVLVRLETDGGLTGWGEGTPDPHVTGETFEGVAATLRHLAPALLGRNPLDRSAAMRLLESRVRRRRRLRLTSRCTTSQGTSPACQSGRC